MGNLTNDSGLTQRAADWWDSAPFSGIFLASGFFLPPSRIHARPPAANANRWLAAPRANTKNVFDSQVSFYDCFRNLNKAKPFKQGENMQIFNLIRGHFALLIDKPMETPAKSKPFVIKSVSTKEGDWQITLEISTGNAEKIYVSDILRVYTFIVSSNRPLTQAEVDKFAEKNCITKRTSYIIPLLSTFSDIEIKNEPKLTIQFIPTLTT